MPSISFAKYSEWLIGTFRMLLAYVYRLSLSGTSQRASPDEPAMIAGAVELPRAAAPRWRSVHGEAARCSRTVAVSHPLRSDQTSSQYYTRFFPRVHRLACVGASALDIQKHWLYIRTI
jgi:hypothetical protein